MEDDFPMDWGGDGNASDGEWLLIHMKLCSLAVSSPPAMWLRS